MAIEYMKKEGMKISSLHTGNQNAMRLYKSLGIPTYFPTNHQVGFQSNDFTLKKI